MFGELIIITKAIFFFLFGPTSPLYIPQTTGPKPRTSDRPKGTLDWVHYNNIKHRQMQFLEVLGILL